MFFPVTTDCDHLITHGRIRELQEEVIDRVSSSGVAGYHWTGLWGIYPKKVRSS
jgi:hypothetical protein